jgi:hypothetical protein
MRFLQRRPFLTIWLAMALVVLTGLVAQTRLNDRVERKFARERATTYAAVCSGVEWYTDTLISVWPIPPNTPRSVVQEGIDNFQIEANKHFATFGCNFHFFLPP